MPEEIKQIARPEDRSVTVLVASDFRDGNLVFRRGEEMEFNAGDKKEMERLRVLTHAGRLCDNTPENKSKIKAELDAEIKHKATWGAVNNPQSVEAIENAVRSILEERGITPNNIKSAVRDAVAQAISQQLPAMVDTAIAQRIPKRA